MLGGKLDESLACGITTVANNDDCPLHHPKLWEGLFQELIGDEGRKVFDWEGRRVCGESHTQWSAFHGRVVQFGFSNLCQRSRLLQSTPEWDETIWKWPCTKTLFFLNPNIIESLWPYQSNESKTFGLVNKDFAWLSILGKQFLELLIADIVGQVTNEQTASLGVGLLTGFEKQRKGCFEFLQNW